MNTFDAQTEYVEKQQEPETGPPPDENLQAPVPPQVDDSLPVLPRPSKQRAEAFLPEWLRRLSHG